MTPQLTPDQNQILNRLFKASQTQNVRSSLETYAKKLRQLKIGRKPASN